MTEKSGARNGKVMLLIGALLVFACTLAVAVRLQNESGVQSVEEDV